MIEIEKSLGSKFWFPFTSSKFRFKELLNISNYVKFFRYKYQMLTMGYAECDTWNIDHTMIYLNVMMLRDFRNDSERMINEPEFCPILDKIIEGFEAKYKLMSDYEFKNEFNDYKEPDYKIWVDKNIALWKDGMSLYVKNFSRLWD